MIEKLELSQDQVSDILDTDSFFRTKQATLKTELRKLQLDMKQICMAESFDKRVLMQIADQIAELKKTLYLEETEARLAIRYLLTPEQVEKLRLNRTERKPLEIKRRSGDALMPSPPALCQIVI